MTFEAGVWMFVKAGPQPHHPEKVEISPIQANQCMVALLPMAYKEDFLLNNKGNSLM